MSLITEMARKQAGIADLSKGYPKNPRERGCAYWSRFIAAVGVLTDRDSAEIVKLSKENAQLSRELAAVQKELASLKFKHAGVRVKHEVEALPEITPAARTKLIGLANGSQ